MKVLKRYNVSFIGEIEVIDNTDNSEHNGRFYVKGGRFGNLGRLSESPEEALVMARRQIGSYIVSEKEKLEGELSLINPLIGEIARYQEYWLDKYEVVPSETSGENK